MSDKYCCSQSQVMDYEVNHTIHKLSDYEVFDAIFFLISTKIKSVTFIW